MPTTGKMGEVSRKTVEEYLLKHPEFAKDWYVKHPQHVPAAEKTDRSTKTKKVDKSPTPPSTPVPLADKEVNSIAGNLFMDIVQGKRKQREPLQKKNLQTLKELDEKELFMELIRDIANELDVNVLCHKILTNVSVLTNSDRGSLFLTRASKQGRHLVSKLFDVTQDSKLEDSVHTEENEITVPFGVGIAGHVAKTKEVVNIKNAYEDPRFNKEVDKKTGYRTHSILCEPILNYDGEVTGVAQIINKVTGSHDFTKQDEEIFRNYLTFCGIGLTNAQLFEMSVQEYQRNQLLLKLARGIFEEQNNLERLVEKIMTEAQELLRVERSFVFLLEDVAEGDEERYTKTEESSSAPKLGDLTGLMSSKRKTQFEDAEDVYFVKAFEYNAKNEKISCPSEAELVNSRYASIAKETAASGKALNLTNEEANTLFGNQQKSEPEFRMKHLLCMPVCDSAQRIVGVAQMINKSSGTPFNETDINIFEAFSIFCGLGIHNTQMYENAVKLMAKQSVALEVLSYHATAQPEETAKLVNAVIPAAKDYELHTFEFDDFIMDDDDTLKLTIRMFLEFDFINKFHIPYDVLCRWTGSVKKNYRPVTYHNWRHAFNVAQSMFTMLTTGGLKQYFTLLDCMALLVACLCHDLDHRGTNNAFQSKAESPLALLYGTSTMEHHHFDHCIMILNSEGNNIFQPLSPPQYRSAIKVLESAILSTDLALYFKKRGNFEKLVDAREVEWDGEEKKDLLRGMMMTACDVAAITKPWEVQKRTAHLVAGEFFEQGDVERQQLGLEPIAMMDRQKSVELPKMQVGFIDAICMPIYKLFADEWDSMKPMYDGCMDNRSNWQQMADDVEKGLTSKNEELPSQEKEKTKKAPGVMAAKGAQKKEIPENTQRKNQRNVGQDVQKKDKSRTCIIL